MKISKLAGQDLAKMSQGSLQDNYTDLAEFKRYSEMYGLHKRLGFETPATAWKANPLIQWSTNPADFKRVHPKRTK